MYICIMADIYSTLELIRNKGNNFTTIGRAKRALATLKPLLPENEYWKILIALSHKENGDSDTEINDVLKEITPKYIH